MRCSLLLLSIFLFSACKSNSSNTLRSSLSNSKLLGSWSSTCNQNEIINISITSYRIKINHLKYDDPSCNGEYTEFQRSHTFIGTNDRLFLDEPLEVLKKHSKAVNTDICDNKDWLANQFKDITYNSCNEYNGLDFILYQITENNLTLAWPAANEDFDDATRKFTFIKN